MGSLVRFFAALGILTVFAPTMALAQTVPLLTVASASQPEATVALPSQTVPAVAVSLTAGGNADVSITGITVAKTGSGADAAVAGLQANTDATTVVGTSGGFSNGAATIPVSLTIPAGQTDTLLVSVETASNLTPYLNQFIGLNITGIQTSAVIQGPLPVYGTQLTLSSGVYKPTCSLAASPSVYGVGQTVDLTWTSTNATGGTITGLGSVGPSGLQGILPSGSGTYTGTFTGAGGTGTCQTSVTFNPQLTGGVISSGGVAAPGSSQTSGGTTATGGACNGGVGSCASGTTVNGEPTTPQSGSGIGQVCNGVNCSACNVASLLQRVINFFIGFSIPFAAALFAWAGILYFTSAANPRNIERAHQIFKYVLGGFLVVICGWLIVQTVLHAVLTPQQFQSWNTISCTDISQRPGTVAGVGGNTTQIKDLLGVITGTTAAGSGGVAVGTTPTSGGGGSTGVIQAICQQESGCGTGAGANQCNSWGACGPMQIEPATACQTNPNIDGCTTNANGQGVVSNLTQVQNYLNSQPLQDSQTLGAAIYNNNLNGSVCNGNITCAVAEYNGGSAAVAPSVDCPGLQAYQCLYDSPGCYNTGVTSCTPNTGFQQTRDYVKSVCSKTSCN